jgi:hypothetical protein
VPRLVVSAFPQAESAAAVAAAAKRVERDFMVFLRFVDVSAASSAFERGWPGARAAFKRNSPQRTSG